MTETGENCSLIVKLEVQGLETSSSDTVTVNDGVTTTTTALIPVNQLITSATLIATYTGEITRKSDLIDFIGKVSLKCNDGLA